jgi:hypothetical protein
MFTELGVAVSAEVVITGAESVRTAVASLV